MRQGRGVRTALLAAVLASLLLPARGEQPAADEWLAFEGTWSATGERQTLVLDEGREAAIVRMSGPLVLTSGKGLPRGFLTETIGFADGRGHSIGAAVWTDDRGDKIFSDVTGGPIQTGRRLSGAVRGGTGRYAGLTGEWTLDWQFVIQGEGDTFQARSVNAKVRIRFGRAPAGEAPR